MFGALTDKFQSLFAKLTGKSKLTEENIAEAVSEVRLALLEADVNYAVVKTLIKRVKEKALGDAVIKSVAPGQQFIKIVHDELVALMGGAAEGMTLQGTPAVIALCGLQGSGKTTQAAKLANYLRKQKLCKAPLLVACDLQRPAAIDQLRALGLQIDVPVFTLPGESNAVVVAKRGVEEARLAGCDLVILDTAGRLHIDEVLMAELEAIIAATRPVEVLFVANATTGQDAVATASAFNQKVPITGTILTMLDGNARGGAAISIREVTGRPLKFEGIGEKIDDLQPFNPTSMADRILGMGDTINLVRKAQEHINEEDAKQLERKMRSATFTYEDCLKQLQMVKKMGSLKGMLGMLPGMSKLEGLNVDDKEFFKMEAIIQSMTLRERSEDDELSVPRRKRVAKGSGTSVEDVNKLVKTFKQMKQFFKNMPNMKQLEKMFGGASWR